VRLKNKKVVTILKDIPRSKPRKDEQRPPYFHYARILRHELFSVQKMIGEVEGEPPGYMRYYKYGIENEAYAVAEKIVSTIGGKIIYPKKPPKVLKQEEYEEGTVF